jgi:hypothetical protein
MITKCFQLLPERKREETVSNFAGRYTATGSPHACIKNVCINNTTTNNMLALGALNDVKNDHIMITSKKSKAFLWRKENHLLPVLRVQQVRYTVRQPQGVLYTLLNRFRKNENSKYDFWHE